MRCVNPRNFARSAWVVAWCASCRSDPGQPLAATARAPAAAPTEWAGERSSSIEQGETRGAAGPGPRCTAPSAATWVLQVGDSFVDASLKQRLAPHFRATGIHYVVRSATASYTTTWAHSAELDELLSRRPSLVIVTLGANEFDIPTPSDHARPIETIARKIARAGAACVWTSPPMWRPDTGIVQVIHDHCAPCLFFDTDAVLGGLSRGERRADRVHPNERGGGRWAQALWDWLVAHRDPSSDGWALLPFEKRQGGCPLPTSRLLTEH